LRCCNRYLERQQQRELARALAQVRVTPEDTYNALNSRALHRMCAHNSSNINISISSLAQFALAAAVRLSSHVNLPQSHPTMLFFF
jgi:hypothetical protein